MNIIAPSILSADFTRLGKELKAVEDAGADWIHIDVMDGHFVPNITYGPIIVEASKKACSLPLDVHLMIENPDDAIPEFMKAGADLVSVHAEACIHLNRTVQIIKNAGKKAGVAINPGTSLDSIDWTLEYLDFVLIMSVNPGFAGQSFISNALRKIEALKKMIDARGLSTIIQIDGGVNENTIEDVARAGADAFVAGSAIFGSNDYQTTIESFKKKIDGVASGESK